MWRYTFERIDNPDARNPQIVYPRLELVDVDDDEALAQLQSLVKDSHLWRYVDQVRVNEDGTPIRTP